MLGTVSESCADTLRDYLCTCQNTYINDIQHYDYPICVVFYFYSYHATHIGHYIHEMNNTRERSGIGNPLVLLLGRVRLLT